MTFYQYEAKNKFSSFYLILGFLKVCSIVLVQLEIGVVGPNIIGL